jgi:hypothetical protein
LRGQGVCWWRLGGDIERRHGVSGSGRGIGGGAHGFGSFEDGLGVGCWGEHCGGDVWVVYLLACFGGLVLQVVEAPDDAAR